MTKPDHEVLLDRARRKADAMRVLSDVADAERRDAVLAAVEAGMSQSEIARRLGLTQGYVNKLINKK